MGQSDFSNTALLAFLMVLLPLLSFFTILAGGKGKGSGIAIFNIGTVFLISIYLFFQIWNRSPVHEHTSWFFVGETELTAGILLNNLSVLMMVLVSGISLLVHIYSLSYMKADPDIHRYWAYLGLFCFSMLGLVIADSLLLIYLFWELVGFSSYLLIGFWFTKDSASQAAKKAFIMNRIGDLGFLCGIMIIYFQFNTLDLIALFGDKGLVGSAAIRQGMWISGSAQMPALWLSAAGLSFFIGAIAKSAQFPLHTWLPDAMEGPTSVSSLIHAATMVAAGIFLIARVYPLFDPLVLNIITVTGLLTAFMAATIALTQNDIKRILAYSTISQLGFMITAMGIGAYAESIFHLATHAFFKCLLFLAAGSVIHQLHHLKETYNLAFDHQDIRFMGGLKRKMPITCITMCIASAALVGLPFTSGYLSKDALLITSFDWSFSKTGISRILPYILSLSSWMTAFYSARLIFKVFFGRAKYQSGEAGILTDPPASMSYILLILAFCSTFILFSLNPFSYDVSWILQGLPYEVSGSAALHITLPLIINLGSVVIIYLAYRIYVTGEERPFLINGFIYRFSNREWYFNEVYNLVFVRSAESISRLCYSFDRQVIDRLVHASAYSIRIMADIADWLDRNIVDGLVNFIADLAKGLGNLSRKAQTGRLQHYLLSMLFIVITFFILTYLI